MSDTGDGEEEWEEQYVAVELVGMIDPDKLTLCTVDNTAILGVSSKEMTVLKLGGYAFAGQYDDVLGSIVVFEECDVSGDESKAHVNYLCHTTKVLKANRVFLKSKKQSEDGNIDVTARDNNDANGLNESSNENQDK